MDRLVRLSSLLLVVIVCFSALTALVQQTETSSLYSQEVMGGMSSGNMDLRYAPAGKDKLFDLVNTTGVSYLRVEVLNLYLDGMWIKEESGFEKMVEWSDLNEHTPEVDMTVVPAMRMSGGIPILKDCVEVDFGNLPKGRYNTELQVLRSNTPVLFPYHVKAANIMFPRETLEAANVTSEEVYTQVPTELQQRLLDTASMITVGLGSPYEKARALNEFIRENYEYRFDFSSPPDGVDPMEWFLYNSKEGVCTHYNTAFIMLARSLGIPARMVYGFMVNPYLQNQEVTGAQAHAYAEVRFDGLGWIIMDATGLRDEQLFPDESTAMTMAGVVFEDLNMNQIRDPNERGLADQELRISGSGGPLKVVTTDEGGAYSYRYPNPGPYGIDYIVPEGWRATTNSSIHMNFIGVRMEGLQFGAVRDQDVGGGASAIHTSPVDPELDKTTTFSVSGRLESLIGRSVEMTKVRVYLQSPSTVPERTLVAETNVIDGQFSAVCWIPRELKVGNYRLVVRSLGNSEHSPVEDEHFVRVTDHVTMQFLRPEKLAAGVPVTVTVMVTERTSGRLLDGITVHLEVPGADMWPNDRNVTSDFFGQAVFTVRSWNVGLLTLRAISDDFSFFSDHQIKDEVPVVLPMLSLSSESLVRGEINNLIFRAQAEEAPLIELKVRFDLEGGERAGSETDSEGFAILSVPMGNDSQLGPRNVTVVALVRGDSIPLQEFSIDVTARTVLLGWQEGDVLKARLTDDHGVPFPGTALTVRSGGDDLHLTTDINGTISLPLQELGALECTVAFAGEGSYLPSTADVVLQGEIEGGFPYMTLLMVLVLIVGVLGTVAYLRPRRAVGSSEIDETEPDNIDGPHILTFPQIPQGMPLIWAPGEPLEVNVATQDEQVILSIDGGEFIMDTSSGGATVTLLLAAGANALRVKGDSGQTKRTVYISSFREAIAATLAQVVKDLPENDLRVQTPREVQAIIKKGLDEPRAKSLDELLDLFERSEYGPSEMRLDDYQQAYRLMVEVMGRHP